MRYLKTYDNFQPVVNKLLDKPYKVKKNIGKGIKFLQRRIKSLRTRLDDEKQKDDRRQRSDMNQDKNDKIQKLKDLTFKQLQQSEYLKVNPVKEDLEIKDEIKDEIPKEEPKNLLDFLESDFKPEDIEKYIGLKEKNYEIRTDWNYRTNENEPSYDYTSLTIFIKSEILESLMNTEQGVINYMLSMISSYSQYEYNVDDDELNYFGRYLTEEIITKIKKLGKLFNIKLKTDENGIKEGEIHDLFIKLGLKRELQDFKYDIQSEFEKSVKKCAKETIKALPFEITHNYGDKDLEITFSYESIIEHIKTNKLSDIKTIKDFLKNIIHDLSYEIEYGNDIYSNLGDFKDLNNEVENVVEKYIDNPDDVFVKLIEVDNLKLFKKKVDLARFDYTYDLWISYTRERMNLFQLAKHYKNSIYVWFNSSEFDSFIDTRSEDELTSYKEFKYGEDIQKYNM